MILSKELFILSVQHNQEVMNPFSFTAGTVFCCSIHVTTPLINLIHLFSKYTCSASHLSFFTNTCCKLSWNYILNVGRMLGNGGRKDMRLPQ